MMQYLLNHYAGWGTEALALVLGAVFLVHGSAKVRKPAGMAAGMGWPKKGILLLGLVECAAALAVIIGGMAAMYGALAMALIMLGAIYSKIFRWKTAFWSHTSTGWEFDLVILAGALVLLLG